MIARLNKEISPDSEKVKNGIRHFQQLWRSHSRYKLHLSIFKQDPLTSLNIDFPFLNAFDAKRIINIIDELSLNRAVISQNVYHWTTLGNLQGIAAHGYFYGNKFLNNTLLKFEANALGNQDIANGDENTICFCPSLVDDVALREKIKFDMNWGNSFVISTSKPGIRNGLMRLTIDLEKKTHTEKYNEYFKIFDFCSPMYNFLVKISEELSFKILKTHEALMVGFDLNGLRHVSSISKNDAVFYGGLNAINRFCLVKIVDSINQADEAFKKSFYDYISGLSNDEIKKIFILCTQWMTVFSEYNFNTALRVSDGLIKEIYWVETNQLITLNSMGLEKTVHDIIHGKIDPLSVQTLASPLLHYDGQDDKLTQYGIPLFSGIDRDIPTLISHDFSQCPSALFASNDHVETRFGMQHQLVTKEIRMGGSPPARG